MADFHFFFIDRDTWNAWLGNTAGNTLRITVTSTTAMRNITTYCADQGTPHTFDSQSTVIITFTPVPPAPTGACCFDGSPCNEATQADCTAATGTYQGDGTSCTPSPCPPIGSCCVSPGACTIETEAGCLALSGAWNEGGNCAADCNNNEYPDECDLTLPLLASLDCNENGVPDECDIRFGTSQDCNRNGFPDECDIASGVSADDNNNGIPDECETGTQAQAGGGSDEAWAAFHEWCCQQSWGPPAEHSCSCQFQHYVDRLNELGLPLVNPAAETVEPAD